MMNRIERQIGVGSVTLSRRAKRYLGEVIESNRLTYGPFSQRFEQAFAQAHDAQYGVFVNSGTSALQIAVAALKEKYQWKDGEEILVPALTFVASSNVILKNNLTPVFVDVDARYYNIDPQKIEKAITQKTRGIMVVHLFGQPADMDPIMRLAEKYNLRIIEDSCETMFARYKGKSVGSFGDISCFSTYACHIICTGVGGLAVTSDPDIAVLLRSLANHGRDAIYFSMDHDKTDDPKKLEMIMEKRFNFIRLGYSYRATEMEAALGLAQLEEIHQNIPRRRKNAQFLLQELNPWEKNLQLPILLPGAEHSFMMFPIVITNPAIKKRELTFFLEQQNIETRDMVPLTNQPYKQKLFGTDLEDKFPVAKNINKNGFYIGCHPDLTRRELSYMKDAFNEFFRHFPNTISQQ